jgi:hypothetical protein
MRALAAGLTDRKDAEAIRIYAAWLGANPEDEEVKALIGTKSRGMTEGRT